MNAVIHKNAFDRISNYIRYARESKDCDIVYGGECDDSIGYFIEPTIIITRNHQSKTMQEEIFGPVITIYVYEDNKWQEMLNTVDSTSDKCSGAVVGQQPFGGSRASGTDDKAGSKLNLLRWVSPRLISTTHNPPTDFKYDYMD